MKKVWISYCTEYESGWGQRPDGFIMSDDREAMVNYINTTGNTGSHDYFWRYSEPKEVYCEMKTFKKIVGEMKEGVAHYNNINKLELFDKLK